ncbi:K02A2.1 [Symbiodinium microadriaticum]|nr:K02A2.1 [Symbiodinium microadriaticum]
MVAKVLLHSGVKDDAATDMAMLEEEFESAGATYEIARYGSGIYHSFTEWTASVPMQAMYDQRADVRSWESTKHFLMELFVGLPAAEREPECDHDHDHDHDNQVEGSETSSGMAAFLSSALGAVLALLA